MIAFGVWDITFYAFLKLLVDWPASLGTWDILFLLPVPWVGPVVAPVLVSVAMIGAGVWHLRAPVRIGAAQWGGILTGALVIIVAFAMALAGCGASAKPLHAAPTDPSGAVRMKAMVRAWTANLDAGNNAAEARLFSLPARISTIGCRTGAGA